MSHSIDEDRPAIMSEADVNRLKGDTTDVQMGDAPGVSPSSLASTKRKADDKITDKEADDDGYEAEADEKVTATSDGFRTPPRPKQPIAKKAKIGQGELERTTRHGAVSMLTIIVITAIEEVQLKAGKFVFKQKPHKFANTTAHLAGEISRPSEHA